MTSPFSNAYKDTYRNALRYTGQNYRFVPTFLRQRDPIAPQNMSPDIKPGEQQGYYPVNSLWTNTTNKNVWLLRGISNNLGDWVLISGGGGGGSTSINTSNALVPANGGIFYFTSPNITITGNAGTGEINFDATPVLDLLTFIVPNGPFPNVRPIGGNVNITSTDNTVVVTGSTANTIDLSVPGVLLRVLTDRDTADQPGGTVVPVNNQIRILGNPPNLPFEGIISQQSPVAGPFDTVYLHYANGFVTTVGATTVTAYTATMDDNVGFTFSAMITGFEGATGSSFGGRMVIIGKKVLGVVSVVTEIENISGGSAGLAGCSFSAVGSGATLLIQVRGLAAKTIKWHVIVPWINVQGAL